MKIIRIYLKNKTEPILREGESVSFNADSQRLEVLAPDYKTTAQFTECIGYTIEEKES